MIFSERQKGLLSSLFAAQYLCQQCRPLYICKCSYVFPALFILRQISSLTKLILTRFDRTKCPGYEIFLLLDKRVIVQPIGCTGTIYIHFKN